MSGPKSNDRLCPAARKSSPSEWRHGREVVRLGAYIPHLLVTVNNSLSRGASRLYLEKFGIGIVEWRVVSMLAIESPIPASRICEVIALDKAATSRALKRLDELGYLRHRAPPSNPRGRLWSLNEKGYGLHDRVLTVALERERRLIDGVPPEDLEIFLKVIRRMSDNLFSGHVENPE